VAARIVSTDPQQCRVEKEVASRVRAWDGKRINTTNPEAFVKSLQRAGFIRKFGEFPK
jgi:hypothetical protein